MTLGSIPCSAANSAMLFSVGFDPSKLSADPPLKCRCSLSCCWTIQGGEILPFFAAVPDPILSSKIALKASPRGLWLVTSSLDLSVLLTGTVILEFLNRCSNSSIISSLCCNNILKRKCCNERAKSEVLPIKP